MIEKFPSIHSLNLQNIDTYKKAVEPENKSQSQLSLTKESKETIEPKIDENQAQTSKSTNQGGNPLQQSLKENNVIKIIQKEWDKEIDRLDAKKNGFKPKAGTNLDKSCVQSGHAEIEANKILFIYGNALEVL